MTSYLVTGASGQLGKCFQEVARNFPNKQFYFTTRREVDLNSPETLEKFYSKTNFDCILNCATYTNVNLAELEKDKAFGINQHGVSNLIDFALKKELKIIHFSSDYVFDGSQKRPYIETDICNPINIYGKSKLAGEMLLKKAIIPTVCFRTSWLFSPYGVNFVKTILRESQTEKELKIISDQCGNPTYGLDLAVGVLRCIDHPRFFDNSTYHLAQEPATNWYRFAKKILELSRIKTSLIPIKSSTKAIAKRPNYSVINTQYIKKTLSLNLRSWESALEECINKIQTNESV